ncbi:MAG TPA: TonB C-terminal domain-containing protein [Oculatellaceae cyanobacterium]
MSNDNDRREPVESKLQVEFGSAGGGADPPRRTKLGYQEPGEKPDEPLEQKDSPLAPYGPVITSYGENLAVTPPISLAKLACTRRDLFRRWFPPSGKARLVTVKFSIAPDGEICNKELLVSSGLQNHDDAALAALHRFNWTQRVPNQKEKVDIVASLRWPDIQIDLASAPSSSTSSL